jgi:hypothetical protein
MDLSYYNRITIGIIKWCLPYRRVRVENVKMGMEKVYTKSDITSLSHTQSMDIVVAELPKNNVTLNVNNLSREYDIRNPSGLTKYLTEKQEIKVKYGYKLLDDVEWINGGVFYLSKWDAKGNSNGMSYKAVSLLESLTMVYGIDEFPPESRSLYDLAETVLRFANIPLTKDGKVRWEIDESLKDVHTFGVLPEDTVANCLQLIANAGCCALYCDRNGIIQIKKRNVTPTDYAINPFNSLANPEMAISQPVKSITIDYDSFSVDEEKQDVRLASTGYFGVRDRDIWIFSIPYRCDGEKVLATGVSLVTSWEVQTYNITKRVIGSSRVELEVVPIRNNGYVGNLANIIVYGNVTTRDTASVTLPVDEYNKGEEIKLSNPLISTAEHAMVVAEWVRDSIIKRRTLSLSWRSDPRADAGDVVTVTDKYGNENVIMTDVDYSYNGAFRGRGEGRVL